MSMTEDKRRLYSYKMGKRETTCRLNHWGMRDRVTVNEYGTFVVSEAVAIMTMGDTKEVEVITIGNGKLTEL